MSTKLSFIEMGRRLKGQNIGNLREKLKSAGEKVPTDIRAKAVLAQRLGNKTEKQRDDYLRKGLGLRDYERKKIEKKFFGQGEKTLDEQKLEKKAAEKKEKLNIFLGKRSAEEMEEYKKEKGGWYKSGEYSQGFAGQQAGYGSDIGFAGPGQKEPEQDNQPAGAPGRAKFQTIGGAGNPPSGDDKNNTAEPPKAPPITLLPI